MMQELKQRRSQSLATPTRLRAGATRDHAGAMNAVLINPISERICKVEGQTPRSVGHIERPQQLPGNHAEYIEANDMLTELRNDNKTLETSLRKVHNFCNEHSYSVLRRSGVQ